MTTSVRCPACEQDQVLTLRAGLSLPPTGGDYEWCESREEHDCPACGARLELTVRVWLADRAATVEAVALLPPRPHPYAPMELAAEPDGLALACRGEAGAWVLDRSGATSVIGPISDRYLRESVCPSFAWSQDGRLALADGRILGPDGRELVRLEWPHTELIGLGWVGNELVTGWLTLDFEADVWRAGLDRIRPDGSWLGIEWEHPGDDTRDERVLVGAAVLRVVRESSLIVLMERWEIQGDAWQRVGLHDGWQQTGPCELTAGTLTAIVGASQDTLVEVALSPMTTRRRLALPAALLGDWGGWIRGLARIDAARWLVVSREGGYILRDAGDALEVEAPLDIEDPRAVTRWGDEVVVANPWALYRLSGQALEPLPLPLPTAP